MNLTNILINIGFVALALAIHLYQYSKERRLRIQAERVLEVVKEMGNVDDQIFRMRVDDPEEWPVSPQAQSLIRRRVRLHEEYSGFLGHHTLRDSAYIIELKQSASSK